jgi:glycosyltransferase involved in cell wall biosynthesis
LRTEGGISLTRAAFEIADVATLRDPDSKDLLASLGLETSRIQVTADPVFNLAPATEASTCKKPLVGVCLRNWDLALDTGNWERQVAVALDNFAESHNATIAFLPFHKTVDWPLTDDLGLAERVRSMLVRTPDSLLLANDYTPAQKAAFLAKCDIVLGMRLHSVIMAHAAAVPVVALTFEDPKVRSAMARVDCGTQAIDLRNLVSDHLLAVLEQTYRDRAVVSASLRSHSEPLCDLARRNASLAIALLNAGSADTRQFSAGVIRLIEKVNQRGCIDDGELAQLISQFLSMHEQAGARAEAPGPDFARDLGRSLEAARLNQPQDQRQSRNSRKPSGSRPRVAPRVACLTNRLLDWQTKEPHFGGAERYCVQLGSLLRELGLDVTFFQASNQSFQGDYYGFHVVGLGPGESFSEFQFGVCNAFNEATRDFDHVIYHMPNYASGRVRSDALMICHDIWFDHESHAEGIVFRTPEWFRHLYAAFSQPARIVSVDTNSINVIRALWPDLASKMTYLPNWVDVSTFRPVERRASEQLTVLFPRRSEVIKGAAILGSILDRVPHQCRFLWWLGEGTPEGSERVKAAARRDPRLQFYSVDSYEKMPAIYQSADICVIPSTGSEATSLACLEALASGCAVVATNIGGLPNLIQPGINGLLVDPEPERIADAINHLIENENDRTRLQHAAQLSAQGFRVEVWQERWTALLNSLGWIDTARSPRIPAGIPVPVPGSLPTARTNESNGPSGEMSDGLRSYDVICFSIIDWEFRWQRPQQMMSRFAAIGHRVFYISISRFAGRNYEAVPLAPNVWEIRLGLPHAIDVYAGVLPAGFARLIGEGLKSLRDDFEITHAVSMVQIATWTRTALEARDLFGWTVVYDCMDNWSTFPGLDTRIPLIEEERRLVESADLLVVSSDKLWDKWSSQNANSLLARNATDFDFFSQGKRGDVLAGVPSPIVGYFGAIAEWFDIELMVRIARERPQYRFVLLGGVYDVVVDELERLSNVQLLGEQPYELMPAYLAAFDACIIPFLVNRATEAMDVVKFYEYASQGKPVVSTSISQIIQYKDYIYLSDSPEDFLVKLDAAVAERDPQLREGRISLARENTWHVRVTDIKRAIHRAGRLRAATELLRDLNKVALRNAGSSSDLSLHLKAGLDEREQALQILSSRLTANERSIADLTQTVAQLTQTKTSLADQINELTVSNAALVEQISERDNRIAALHGEMTELRSAAESAAANAESSLEVLGERIESTAAEIELLRSKAGEHEQALNAANEKSSEMTRIATGLRSHLAEEKRHAEMLVIQRNQAERQIESLKNSRGLRIMSRFFRSDPTMVFKARGAKAGAIEARREGTIVVLSWSSRRAEALEVHVHAPDGPLFSRSGQSGEGRIDWLQEETTFFLQDVSAGLPLTLTNTLDTVTVSF